MVEYLFYIAGGLYKLCQLFAGLGVMGLIACVAVGRAETSEYGDPDEPSKETLNAMKFCFYVMLVGVVGIIFIPDEDTSDLIKTKIQVYTCQPQETQ